MNFTERLRKTLFRPDPLADAMLFLAKLALGLSCTAFIIVLVRAVLRL